MDLYITHGSVFYIYIYIYLYIPECILSTVHVSVVIFYLWSILLCMMAVHVHVYMNPASPSPCHYLHVYTCIYVTGDRWHVLYLVIFE